MSYFFLVVAQIHSRLCRICCSVTMFEEDDDFQDLIKRLNLPSEVKGNFLLCACDCTLTFGLAFSSMQVLDQNIHKFLPSGDTDHSSPTCARIRALWTKCNTLHSPSQQLNHFHQLLWLHLLWPRPIHHQVGMNLCHLSSASGTWNQ